MADEIREIKKKKTIFDIDKNGDDTPIQVVTKDGEEVAEIKHKDTAFDIDKKADGTPIQVVTKEVVPKDR